MTAQQTTSQRIALRRRAIFAACKAAGLGDDARRSIVLEITGCTSMSQCTLTQLGDVLDRLNRSKTGYAGRRRSTPTEDRAPLLAKIDALLAELHRATGQVHTLKYADAIAKRNGWAECVDFADPRALKHIVGALNRTLQHKRAGS